MRFEDFQELKINIFFSAYLTSEKSRSVGLIDHEMRFFLGPRSAFVNNKLIHHLLSSMSGVITCDHEVFWSAQKIS